VEDLYLQFSVGALFDQFFKFFSDYVLSRSGLGDDAQFDCRGAIGNRGRGTEYE
jgi:hypothetical protein